MIKIFGKSACPLFLVFVLFLGAGCATAPGKPGQTRDKFFLPDLCLQYGIVWDLDSVSQVITLKKAGREAKALVGSDNVLIGGERVQISKPLTRSRGSIIVPNDFIDKIFFRLIAQPEIQAFPMRKYKIQIDAGHGGKDPGAIGISGTYEKDVVLNIARSVKSRLAEKNISVIMTRDDDHFLTLEERTEIAAKENVDLFVSIHANSSPSRSVRGMEIYSIRPLSSEEIRENQRVRNQNIMFRNLSMQNNDVPLQRVVADMMFSYKTSESPVLAGYMMNEAVRIPQTSSRGLKKAGFFVLRNTLIPAVLVEVGYLTNTEEERLLKTASYQENIAEGLTRGILVYLSQYQ